MQFYCAPSSGMATSKTAAGHRFPGWTVEVMVPSYRTGGRIKRDTAWESICLIESMGEGLAWMASHLPSLDFPS